MTQANNCLVLLTNYFPYYKGEEYLEAEITYLANSFDKVLIIPTMVDSAMERTREVPSNIEVIRSFTPLTVRHKIGYFLRYVPNAIFKKKIRKKIINECDWNLYKWLYTLYFESRSQAVFKNISKSLSVITEIESCKVTLYSYWFYVTANVAIKLRDYHFKDKSIKIVSRGHGYDINEHIKPFSFLPMRTHMLDEINKLFTVSNEARERMAHQYPKYADKIETRRLGVVRHNEQLSERNPFLVVSCSTIRKLKRIDLIIDALMKIREDGLDFYWVHIGDGHLKESIREEAIKKLGKNKVDFLGSMSNQQVLDFYLTKKPSVFINTSSSEGVPVSIMEALAFSIPIVASDVGGTKEIVFDGVNGFLIEDYSDVDAYYKALKNLFLMDDTQYKLISDSAYKTFKNYANASVLYECFASELKLNN